MFKKRPWLWFIIVWIVFLGMTATTLIIAQKHKPEVVPLEIAPK